MDFIRMRPGETPRASPTSPVKKPFVKMRRMPSDGSQQSRSSGSSIRSAESVDVVVRQTNSRSRFRHHTARLSGVFLRGSASSSSGPMALAPGFRPSPSIQPRKGSIAPGHAAVADDPSELSNQITAPGILKIFGSEICKGAHYKSVLATMHSSAKELVKEALERYGLSKEVAGSYVLCDAIGSLGGNQWKTEGFRVVGDHEKPLLLQSLWKPREGLARRFEIQRRSSVDEKRSKEKDTVTAGINAQARKLQKSRSRVNSTLIQKTLGRGQNLWRSKSEMDLLSSDGEAQRDADRKPGSEKGRCRRPNPSPARSPGRGVERDPTLESQEQNDIQSRVHNLSVSSGGDAGRGASTETFCPPQRRGEREREESEREETESSDDNTTLYSIHPPHDSPYLLLLQGYSLTQEFVIYPVTGQSTVIGRGSERDEGSKVDVLLFAPDIIPRHCCLRRHSNSSPALLQPYGAAKVTRNGEALCKEVELRPGDVIGLGQYYLFLFKDPLTTMLKELNDVTPEPNMSALPWLSAHATVATTAAKTREPILCNTCISARALPENSGTKPPRTAAAPFPRNAEGHSRTLNYEPGLEDRIVKEIVATGDGGLDGGPALSIAFLLCACVQHSAAHLQPPDLRRLLLLISAHAQTAVWEHSRGVAAAQPDVSEGTRPGETQPLELEQVTSGLRPLALWMSNSLELLHFIQHELPLILDWRNQRERGQKDDEYRGGNDEKEEENLALLEPFLSCIRSASEETMAVLEEIIMLTFQQCVYYITKILYPVLPGVLDCDPFGDGVRMPRRPPAPGVSGSLPQVLEVLSATRRLLLDCQVHPEMSSQLLGYIFYFISASLFNTLMERGSEVGFYQWSRGIRIRANIDLLLDWAHGSGSGLGEVVLEHMHTLSSAVSLLATPRRNLLQSSWASLRSDHPGLGAARLHHLLSCYSPASPCPHVWAPSGQDQAAALRTDDILESFDTQHPLVLPGGGYHLQLGRAVSDTALEKQVGRLQELISGLSLPHAQSRGDAYSKSQGPLTVPAEAKLRRMDVLPEASLQSLDPSQTGDVSPPAPPVQNLSPHPPPASVASPPSPLAPRSACGGLDDFSSSCGGLQMLSQKLWSLEAEAEAAGPRRSVLDPSCLLTPPNTPRDLEPPEPEAERQDTDAAWASVVEMLRREGGLVSECLATLTSGGAHPRKIMALKEEAEEKEEEEEEEEEEEAAGKMEEDNEDEVFMLELERGERGLGLALVDAQDTSLRMGGIFIRAVVPDSPASRCDKLVPGDRILAVNGTSLLGVDYHHGRKLIQSSGDRPQLLVARSDWMAKSLWSKC